MPRSKQLDPSILEAALTGLEAQRKRIDEQIANVLTYIRSEWGNKAPPVTLDLVKKVRDQVADHGGPSSEDELKNVPEAVP